MIPNIFRKQILSQTEAAMICLGSVLCIFLSRPTHQEITPTALLLMTNLDQLLMETLDRKDIADNLLVLVGSRLWKWNGWTPSQRGHGIRGRLSFFFGGGRLVNVSLNGVGSNGIWGSLGIN